ncbi:MAG: hypothetical protein UX39_C0005G0027 [Candidatus Magasanikbacteria bacterium GW2011_GWA2_46_17]|uniref:Polymerase nucleotidyl transferase domain-containing protein n=1 Tax=Candidatus Magasanikbacteria bacterium GW2011_GWA2_46_17 TaxID=1619042 RepID=A0A0G1P254_9BACT|nr:MAG: hypothetical protein UX39_C0005G0027 [Candidatus Magasanikbacteria bacterium GW2011_GWA2_46_17]
MASLKELNRLFSIGELGKLLAREFGGTRGYVNQNEDSDFLVLFKSESDTPERDAIGTVVTKHYTGLGYVVRSTPGSEHCFEVDISHKSSNGLIHVVITTHYPHNNGHASLRVTSELQT